MKKLAYTTAVIALIVPVLSLAQTSAPSPVFPSSLRAGDKGDSVKYLQDILRSNSAIYPEGLVTGNFGPLTQEAVRRLQAKYGLPQTGVVDEQTQAILFPTNTQISIISPNGGENWDRGQAHTILWKVMISPASMEGGGGGSVSPGASGSATSGTGTAQPGVIYPDTRPSIYPFFPYVSIDLIRDSNSSFMMNLGTANLYDSQFTWQVNSDIPNGSDFRVRLSVGGDVPCIIGLEMRSSQASSIPYPCPLMRAQGATQNNSAIAFPQYSATDTSDNTFSVSGTITPSSEVVAQLRNMVNQMEATLRQLLDQLNSLKAILGQLP